MTDAAPCWAQLVSGPDGRGPTDGEWGAVAVAVGGFIVVGAVASWLAAAGVIVAIEQAVIGGWCCTASGASYGSPPRSSGGGDEPGSPSPPTIQHSDEQASVMAKQPS